MAFLLIKKKKNISLADFQYGRKSAIVQRWWSLLVCWSHNSRYFIHSTSFDSTVILNNRGGRYLLCLIIYANFSYFLFKEGPLSVEIAITNLTQLFIEYYRSAPLYFIRVSNVFDLDKVALKHVQIHKIWT